MSIFEVRRVREAAVAIGLLTATIGSRNAFSQGDESLAADSHMRELVETLEEAPSQNPSLYPELIEPLTGLGRLYHEEGDYRLAIAATEQARQIVRVHYGLYSVEEAPLLRQLVRSEEARGNVEAAWSIEQDLLALIGRHSTDLRMMPFLREIADRRMGVLERYERGELPAEVILGCYYRDPSCRAGSRRAVRFNLLNEALTYYSHAVNVLLANEGYANDELPRQLMELVEISYRYRRYALGMNSLRQLYSYEAQSSEPWNALLMMADWELIFANVADSSRRRAYALPVYRRAYDLLEQEGVDESVIAALFSPQIPVVLPAFAPNPLVSEKTSESSAYIDVAFEITKEGESDRVEVLDTSMDASRAAKRDLIQLIKRSTFRPIVTNGEIADSARVVVRYYVDEVEG